jgi:hypothetical protein
MWPHERREEQAHSMTKIQITMSLSPDYPLHTTRASEFREKGPQEEKKGEKKINRGLGVASDLEVSEKGERRGQKVKSGMARFTDFLLNPQCVVGVVSVFVLFFTYLPATCRCVNFSTRARACLF